MIDVDVVEVEPPVVSVLDDEFDVGVVVVGAAEVATVVGVVVAAVVAVRVSVVVSSG